MSAAPGRLTGRPAAWGAGAPGARGLTVLARPWARGLPVLNRGALPSVSGGPRTAPLTALRRPRARPRALCPLPAECTRAPGPLAPRVLLAARRASPESSFPALLLRVCEDQGGAGRPPQRCRPRLAAPPRRGPVVPRQDSAAKAWPHWAVFGGCPWTAGTPTFCLGVAAEEHTEPGARRGPARCGGRRSAAPGLLAGRSSPAPAGSAAEGPAAQRPAGALPLAGPRTAPRLPAPLGGRVLLGDL